MSTELTALSHNIRYLRGKQGMSQEDLANQIGIKRSNIAAYETKRVEPKLAIILEISKYFDVSVRSLIDSKMSDDIPKVPFSEATAPRKNRAQSAQILQSNEVDIFIKKSIKVKKILEGFKAFYSFKKNSLDTNSPEKKKLIFDIDNFISLLEHLMSYNESVIKAIAATKEASVTNQEESDVHN